MAETDGLVHGEDWFGVIYKDIEIKNQEQLDKEFPKGVYEFTGDFSISGKSESVRYSLYQNDPKKNTSENPIRMETVPVLRDASDSPTGFTIKIEPEAVEVNADKFGKFAGDDEALIKVEITRNGEPLKIQEIKPAENSVLPDGISIDLGKSDFAKGELVLSFKAGGTMTDVGDDFTRVIFDVKATDTSREQFALVVKKVGQVSSLGRIDYIPTVKKLTNVTYFDVKKGEDVVAPVVYAQINDLVVLTVAKEGGKYPAGTVFKWTGTKWVEMTDLTSATIAFDDIMTLASSTTAQVICKRLIAKQALIDELATKTLNLTEGGTINSGYYVEPKKWNSGIQIKADGTVNIKGANIEVSGGQTVEKAIEEAKKDASVKLVQTCYYHSTSYIYPAAPSQLITEKGSNVDTWSVTRPQYPTVKGGTVGQRYYLFVCTQTVMNDEIKDEKGTVTKAATIKVSEVAEDNSFFETWAITEGKTIISGGKIDTTLINTQAINVGNLGDGSSYATKVYASTNSQTCYLFKADANTPASPGVTWVSAATSTAGVWGNTYPAYPAVSKDNIVRYYLFSCVQTKAGDGSNVTVSQVVRDYSYDETYSKTQGLTVIEGGYIKTDLIQASKISITNLDGYGAFNNAVSTAQTSADNAQSSADNAQSSANRANNATTSEVQTVYYFTPYLSAPAAPSIWVTNSTKTVTTWIKTYPDYPQIEEASPNPTRYYLFKCEQIKRSDGSFSNGSVLQDYSYDETYAKTQGKTIIDGGYIKADLIRAGSIDANKINVDSLMSAELQFKNKLFSQNWNGGADYTAGTQGIYFDKDGNAAFMGNLRIGRNAEVGGFLSQGLQYACYGKLEFHKQGNVMNVTVTSNLGSLGSISYIREGIFRLTVPNIYAFPLDCTGYPFITVGHCYESRGSSRYGKPSQPLHVMIGRYDKALDEVTDYSWRTFPVVVGDRYWLMAEIDFIFSDNSTDTLCNPGSAEIFLFNSRGGPYGYQDNFSVNI